ncbi:MAG: V-type ATP synthase subunit E [Synergistaceae bacterium]|jgi:V/A-type H+-transporting ATPase subunit E|nr:V-type ATP synthase subunit E [Synergistaceae bacterium]
MTQKATPSDAVMYDERKKLSELQSMILQKGDLERERILEEARAEAEKWTSEQTARLNAMVGTIEADAARRSGEMTSRQLIEAESARDKDRLRLQNELIQRALVLFQDALTAFDKRPDYGAILAGLAAEACARLAKGQKVKLRLRAEDVLHGEAVADALKRRFSLDVSFDATPAPIVGGVFLCSEDSRSNEEKWRVVADWKSKADEMADALAKAVLAEL